jgi:RNA polymerase sigma-70 factor (ECF subfamily)
MSGDTDGRLVRFSRNRKFFSGRQVNQKGGSSVSPDVTADAEFVKALHAEHGGPLFAFCVRFTGDRGRAEDVVQEVMLRAWRNLDQLELGDRSIRPWLMTCARNVLTDEHRAAGARPNLVNDDNALVGIAVGGDDIERAVESWTMAEALQRLSDEHREVLIECYWLGRSVAEAAQTLRIPPGTVKSRTYYALRALRLALEEMGVGR